MSSVNLLAIFNPSNSWRSGYLTVKRQPIYQQFQIPPEELVLSDLRDLSHTQISAQVDQVDPEDSSRDILVFSLKKPIPPNLEDSKLASGFVRIVFYQPLKAEIYPEISFTKAVTAPAFALP